MARQLLHEKDLAKTETDLFERARSSLETKSEQLLRESNQRIAAERAKHEELLSEKLKLQEALLRAQQENGQLSGKLQKCGSLLTAREDEIHSLKVGREG